MLAYVTTNPGKVREVEEYLGDTEVGQLDFDYTEIQAAELGPIAAHGAREAYRHAGEPVLVDDAGLFVDGLGGFPGPYSSYVEDTVGVERVWNLVEMEDSEANASGQSSGDEPRDGELIPTSAFDHDLTERYPGKEVEVHDVDNAFVFHVETDGSLTIDELVTAAADSIAERADELEEAVQL